MAEVIGSSHPQSRTGDMSQQAAEGLLRVLNAHFIILSVGKFWKMA